VARSSESWYRAAHSRLLAALVIAAGDIEAARDATSEAFTRALQHRPGCTPEPPEELKARARQRRRRRVSFAAAPASAVAIVVTAGVTWSSHDLNRIETAAPGDTKSPTEPPLLPTRPVLVATGENEGHPWQRQAYESESGLCVDLLAGGHVCFDVSTRPAVGWAGRAAGWTRWTRLPYAGRG
jgi:hypothetical protein